MRLGAVTGAVFSMLGAVIPVAYAQEKPSRQDSDTKQVALFVSDRASKATVAGLVTALKRNLELTARVESFPPDFTSNLAVAARNAATAEDVCAVFLQVREGELEAKTETLVAGKCALVSVGVPSTNSPASSYPAEWRAERALLQFVGAAAGLPPCDFPLCAMHKPANETEIGYPARDICPPCRVKSQKLLGAKPSQPAKPQPPAPAPAPAPVVSSNSASTAPAPAPVAPAAGTATP